MKKVLILFLLLFSVASAQTVSGPESGKNPKLYVNGNFYELKFLKEQLPVVDLVNDRKDADIHILVTSQSTGSGGNEYLLYFYGQNRFDKMNDTIKVITEVNESADLVRGKIVRGIKTGMFNYLRRWGLEDRMSIGFAGKAPEAPAQKEDPWNLWVFRTSFSGYFNGESSSQYSSIYGSLSASRTTEDLRLSFGLSGSYNENSYNYDMDGINYEFTNITRSQSLSASAVKSISDHWSLGGWSSVYKSTYGNIDFEWDLSTGLEYNLFPYSESSQKQLRFTYKLGIMYENYFQETVYFKESEYLATQNASVILNLTQPWGSATFGIYGSNYLQDLTKYSVSLSTYFSLRLVRGLSLNCSFYYSKINNQLSLPRAGASVEDVLLRIRQLETHYSYSASVGLSFSFGSIFNNVVNPRFGGGGSTIYYE